MCTWLHCTCTWLHCTCIWQHLPAVHLHLHLMAIALDGTCTWLHSHLTALHLHLYLYLYLHLHLHLTVLCCAVLCCAALPCTVHCSHWSYSLRVPLLWPPMRAAPDPFSLITRSIITSCRSVCSHCFKNTLIIHGLNTCQLLFVHVMWEYLSTFDECWWWYAACLPLRHSRPPPTPYFV